MIRRGVELFRPLRGGACDAIAGIICTGDARSVCACVAVERSEGYLTDTCSAGAGSTCAVGNCAADTCPGDTRSVPDAGVKVEGGDTDSDEEGLLDSRGEEPVLLWGVRRLLMCWGLL